MSTLSCDQEKKTLDTRKIHISFVLPALYGRGVEKVVLALSRGFLEFNACVDIVLANAEGELVSSVPDGVNIVNLNVPHRLRLVRSFIPLVKYFKNREVDVVFPLFDGFEFVVMLAVGIAYLKKRRPFIIYSCHNVTRYLDSFPSYKRSLAKFFTWLSLRLSDAIIAVSSGVAKDFSQRFHVSLNKMKVIYNPFLLEEIIEKSKQETECPCFISNIPVILGVGRLNKQKDFPTLLKAFALVRKEIDSRLVILGEGEERKNLEQLAKELGIDESLWMPGFVDNPYKYMRKASVFVLSSIYEGLPTVLIEALALGCPVVSTDCPSGPSEILENGRYGKLVPVGDIEALASAILETIKMPLPKEFLQERAKDFSLNNAVIKYLDLIESLKRDT